ncbi:hypothetical protein XO10_04005 [Marinitoga sp. 1135]|uniref:PASTA domain-containing protein n=1 Tax=Marinitoga piezophila (strain DSM 14283 / JCM 11233 / KA3) TaxID=443254 RepID=H2J6V9_MARPK|nr:MULTISPECIES: PASTA domain-containing protein [Marinitoga]AEX85224.1 hypothetical protein Marpi_0800 [Marinitoga piezophila KA3]APT75714.1 hypothetical protein LN42_04440 [Marinitoga sp. 1137]NUU95453.1 hypothetical protein [Marinitoga sp. 1135]
MKNVFRYIKKGIKNLILFILGLITGGTIFFLLIFAFVNANTYVSIPSLMGEDKETAINALKEKGLIPIVKGVGDSVLYTDPPANTKVKKGRHVFIQLGRIEKLKVPDLIGIPVEVAEEFLTEYKLKYKIIKIYYPDEKIETVIDMTPKPNTPVMEGDTIILKVASSEVNK